MLLVFKIQAKVVNTEHAHWCLDGGIKAVHALQNERFYVL